MFCFSVVSSPVHHHTNTYPGATTGTPVITTGVVPGVPVIPPRVVTESPTVHHIHHLPRGKSRSRREHQVFDSEDSESDEEYPAQRRYNFTILELCHVSVIAALPVFGVQKKAKKLVQKFICNFKILFSLRAT